MPADMTMEEVREYERATQEATNLKIGTFPPSISISETPLPSCARGGPNSAPSTPLSTEAPEFLTVPKERPRKKSAPETLTLPDPGRRDSIFKLPGFFSWNSSPQPEWAPSLHVRPAHPTMRPPPRPPPPETLSWLKWMRLYHALSDGLPDLYRPARCTRCGLLAPQYHQSDWESCTFLISLPPPEHRLTDPCQYAETCTEFPFLIVKVCFWLGLFDGPFSNTVSLV